MGGDGEGRPSPYGVGGCDGVSPPVTAFAVTAPSDEGAEGAVFDLWGWRKVWGVLGFTFWDGCVMMECKECSLGS